MQIGRRLVVFTRYIPVALAMPALLLPTPGVAETASTQQAPMLKCITDASAHDGSGNTLVTLQGSLYATKPDGQLVIAVDPSCLVGVTTSVTDETLPDKSADANATIDMVVQQAKQAGVRPDLADQAGADLKDQVENAKRIGDTPSNQVNAGNDALVQKSADNPNDKDSATIAAIAGVAGVCMVATTGICAAAVAAILPSILPASVSSQDVQGVARTLNDLNQGKPPSPEDINTMIDVAGKYGKADPHQLDILRNLAQNGLKVAAQGALTDAGLSKDSAQGVIDLINTAINGGNFSCDAVVKAANINGPIQVSDHKFVDKIVATVENSKYGSATSSEIRDCLKKYFDPGQ
jgi:hypothetical protein